MSNLKYRYKSTLFILLYLIFIVTGCLLIPLSLNSYMLFSQLSNSFSIYSSGEFERTVEILLKDDVVFDSNVRQTINEKLSAYTGYIGIYSGFDNLLAGSFYHSKTGQVETIKFQKIAISTRFGAAAYNYKAVYNQVNMEDISTTLYYINDAYSGLNKFTLEQGVMFSDTTTDEGLVPIVIGGVTMKNKVRLGDKAVIAVGFRINEQETEPITLPCQVVGVLDDYPIIYNYRNQTTLPLTFLNNIDSIVLLPDMSSIIPSNADVLSNNGSQRRCLLTFERGTKIDHNLLVSLNHAIDEYGIVSFNESITQASVSALWLDQMVKYIIPLYILSILAYIIAVSITVILFMNSLYRVSNRRLTTPVAGVIITTLGALVTYWIIPYTSLVSSALLNYSGQNMSLFAYKFISIIIALYSLLVLIINHIHYILINRRSSNHD